MEIGFAHFGKMKIEAPEEVLGKLTYRETSPHPGIFEFHFTLRNDQPEPPREMLISWHLPMRDSLMRWSPFLRDTHYLLPPVWTDEVTSSLAYGMPLVSFLNGAGMNRATLTFSDALRFVKIRAGVYEEIPDLRFELRLFTRPEAPVREYTASLRLDCRDIFYADAIRDAATWFEQFPECVPEKQIPETAFDPVFSTWYNYHQNLFADELEKACSAAASLGMKTVIVDDGWQTDDNHRGYAFCGDWEPSRKRFPDFPAHVKKVHEAGLKYMLWFAVPFVGEKSAARARFEKKSLMFDDNQKTFLLDPRFPDVREYLISLYEKAVREWDIDGLKLDFIDCFQFFRPDPALTDGFGERDILSLPHAADRLLSDAVRRLKKLKPDLLIEFRQSYIGPAIRKYGSMFRACDCPGDPVANRMLTIQLRLNSGSTPVHADMLTWPADASPEQAALALLNILFAVPQISIRPEALSGSHARMLRHHLQFVGEHRETLLKGRLMPYHPEVGYPLIFAETEKEKITAVYLPGLTVPAGRPPPSVMWIFNATENRPLILDAGENRGTYTCFDVFGMVAGSGEISAGLNGLETPPAGCVKIEWKQNG